MSARNGCLSFALVAPLLLGCDRDRSAPVEPIGTANAAPAVATTVQPPDEPDPGELPDAGIGEGEPCGPAECPTGWSCCDEACGVCVRPGEGCMQRACADPL